MTKKYTKKQLPQYDSNLFFLGGDVQNNPNQGINLSGMADMVMPGAGAAMSAVGSVGDSVGGKFGAAIKGSVSPLSATFNKDFKPWQRVLGTINPAIGGIMSYNAQQKEAEENQFNSSMQQRNNMLGIKAMGGRMILPMGTSPNMMSEYENGGQLTEFNNGGTHEASPYQGIPQGQAPDGQTNKVEQGETKWQDYIFSDRLLLDKNTVEQHNLPKSMTGKSFADASKKMSKLYKERPNDPISKNTQKDYMNQLMSANDATRQIEESSMMASGGRLYAGGSKLKVGRTYYDENSNELMSGRVGNEFFKPGMNQPLAVGKLETEKLTSKANDIFANNKETPGFFGDSKNLRYAPIAFNALAGTGLFGKTPTPEQYNPTMIQQQGTLSAPQVDQQTMRAGIDAAYQNQIRGMSDASGGSGAALRAGLTGVGADYMSGVGSGFLGANTANMAAKMQADQYNLGTAANIASQNAQMMNQGAMYNTDALNKSKALNYDNRMSYLGKAAEGVGDIGYEERLREIMPKIFGYTDMAKHASGAKACGGRLRLKSYKK